MAVEFSNETSTEVQGHGMPQNTDNLGSCHTMEVGSSYGQLTSNNDVNSSSSPLSSPVISRRTDHNNSMLEPALQEPPLHQQILQLKHHQQLEQQILLQHFHVKKQQLDEQHLKQQQQIIKEYFAKQQQKKMEEEAARVERDRREKERLDQLKNKEKHEQSAIASSEVKQKLQEHILQRREAQAQANGGSPSTSNNNRNWSVVQPTGTRTPAGADASATTSTTNATSRPYRQPMLSREFPEDVPGLRKYPSEPNLLKVRLKQRGIERRSSPMIRRKERPMGLLKRKSQLAIDTASSTPDSGPNSPPNGASIPTFRSSSGSTPIQEEGSTSPYGTLAASHDGMAEASLYSSHSLPNISEGRPPAPSSSVDGMKLPAVSESELRATRLGVPQTGPLVPGALPIYLSLPVVDSEYNTPTSPAFVQKQMQALEQVSWTSNPILSGLYQAGPITVAQVAQARLHRTGHRPLGRTQSAPLPLGHPVLQGGPGMAMSQQQYEQCLREQRLLEQQKQHNLLKQHIRQTVLTRSGSKNHVENVEEETEAAMARELSQDRERQPELIDLTEKKGEESEIVKQQRDREQFLQQQRDLMMRPSLQISETSAFTPRAPHTARPLHRALSSPLVTLSPVGSSQEPQVQSGKPRFTTGLAYDSLMMRHQCLCGDYINHPEHGGRVQSIWARLQETRLVEKCEKIRSRKATLEEIQTCHSEAHTLLFGAPNSVQKIDMSQLPVKNFVRMPCGGIGVDSDTAWNVITTATAARMAVGCVIELAFKVANGDVKNGLAVVRPPGHHAEHQQAMGFCFFNSVAITAKLLRQQFKMEKILILDWDVHHGNGTQQMFYDDPHILYLSIHRHDDGNFFPGTGGPCECGVEDGIGFSVNLAWSGGLNPPMGDAEYLAAFRTVVMPIVKDFDPEIVLVSAGFDSAVGHAPPLGGYLVSAACFGHMTRQLLQLAGGKVVLALEGGYDLTAISDAAHECVKALLGEEILPIKEEELTRQPCQNAINTLQRTIAIQSQHWPCIKRWAHTVTYSVLEATQKEKEETETVSAMASLSMQQGSSSSMQTSDHSRETSEEPMDQDEAK